MAMTGGEGRTKLWPGVWPGVSVCTSSLRCKHLREPAQHLYCSHLVAPTQCVRVCSQWQGPCFGRKVPAVGCSQSCCEVLRASPYCAWLHPAAPQQAAGLASNLHELNSSRLGEDRVVAKGFWLYPRPGGGGQVTQTFHVASNVCAEWQGGCACEVCG